jgi:chromosomal replication initiator protein
MKPNFDPNDADLVDLEESAVTMAPTRPAESRAQGHATAPVATDTSASIANRVIVGDAVHHVSSSFGYAPSITAVSDVLPTAAVGSNISMSAWAAAIASTRAKSPASFDQWFSGVQFEGLTDGVLGLRARDEFVRDWVDAHFMPAICEHLRRATGLSIQPAWSVGGHLDAPVATHVDARVDGRVTSLSAGPSAHYSTGPGSARFHGAASTVPATTELVGSAAVSHLPSPSLRTPGPAAAPPEGINPRYTFDNFVIGPSNQLAHAAAVAAASGGARHNPIFLCGGTGLGKTHLLHAVAHRVQSERPHARILYVSAERFVNEFVQALQDQKMAEFRARYRERCDVLLVDDIQFLASKTQTQEEFFHAFNALHQADKTIIVTSDKYPQQLERMEERLVSRFTWGLVADIQGPELETRVAILRKKAVQEHMDLSDEIMVYLAQTIRSNVRELEGTLIRLMAKSSLLGCAVTLEFVRQEMAHAMGARAMDVSMDDIQRIVCHHFKLRAQDLLSKDRHKSIAFARHIAMYLCKQRLKCSFPEVGRAFGGRDHTTVISAVRKVEGLRERDAQVRAHLDVLERKLGND